MESTNHPSGPLGETIKGATSRSTESCILAIRATTSYNSHWYLKDRIPTPQSHPQTCGLFMPL